MKTFENSASFSMYIEQLVRDKTGLTHMDAVLMYCKENFVEPEDIKKLINKSLRAKIEIDMQNDGLLPRTATLDI